MKEQTKNQCPEFPFFGAWYPDATCIDGFLWDLDKFEDGKLYGGGEEPCPFCNTETFIEQNIDELNGNTRESLLKYVNALKEHYSTPSKEHQQSPGSESSKKEQ